MAYRPRSDCKAETRTNRPHETCPRCDEVAGAGICPKAGAVGHFALEFHQTFVLCIGVSCHRHRTGYWPPAVHARLVVFDATELDDQLAQSTGLRVARLLGIGEWKRQEEEEPKDWAKRRGFTGVTPTFRYQCHRLVTLLASLQLVAEAARRGLESVLVLEGDVRPLSNRPEYDMPASEVAALGATLRHHPWSIVRLHGYFWSFHKQCSSIKCLRKRREPAGSSYGPPRVTKHRLPKKRLGAAAWSNATFFGEGACPAECTCRPVGEPVHACVLSRRRNCTRACEIAPAPPGTEGCVVKDTVAFAVHRRAFGAFAQQRRRALRALVAVADLVNAAGGNVSALDKTWGLGEVEWRDALPWFDVWLPTSFPNIYVLPSVAVQQIKQADAETTIHFSEHCFYRALDSAPPSTPGTELLRNEKELEAFKAGPEGACVEKSCRGGGARNDKRSQRHTPVLRRYVRSVPS